MSVSNLMFLDGKLLTVFCVAAEELHFGRAAARLFMTQPPLSQHIKRLEEVVDAPLFIRTTRSVRLTPAGQLLYERARRISSDTVAMLRTVRQAARGEAGSLVIGLTPSAASSTLAGGLYQFRVEHPEIDLDLREMTSTAMESAIRLRTLDVALMRPTVMPADIQTIEIHSETMMLVVRKDHKLANSPRVRLQDIAQYPLIGLQQDISPYFRDIVQTMFARSKLVPKIVQESVIPTILTLVEAGAGIAIVPSSLSRTRGDSLVFLPITGHSNPVAKLVAAALSDSMTPTVEKLIWTLQHSAAPKAANLASRRTKRRGTD